MASSSNVKYLTNNHTPVDANTSDETPFDNQKPMAFWSADTLSKVAPVLFVMVATIIGNLVLIILLTHKRTRRKKRVNVFILNLAIADLTVAFITMTTELLEATFKEWVLGPFLCKFLLYFQVVTLSSTTFLLTGMSIDRYQVIVRPLQSLARRPKIKTKVVMAWLMAFVFAIPQVFIFVQVNEYNNNTGITVHYCKSTGYSAWWQRKFYFTFLTFYILLLPAGIMLYCYICIARAIWNRGEQGERTAIKDYRNDAGSPRMSIRRSTMSSSRRKVVFMTLSVIIAYLVCLTPYFIICLIRIYSHYTLDLRAELIVSQLIFMLHSALNPILYGLFTLKKKHITSFCSKCLRYYSKKQHNRQKERHKAGLRHNKLFRFRRGLLFLRRRHSGETSVIIANHMAKEETNIKLQNRNKTRYKPNYNNSAAATRNGPRYALTYNTSSWLRSDEFDPVSQAADGIPVTVPNNVVTDSDINVSNV